MKGQVTAVNDFFKVPIENNKIGIDRHQNQCTSSDPMKYGK